MSDRNGTNFHDCLITKNSFKLLNFGRGLEEFRNFQNENTYRNTTLLYILLKYSLLLVILVLKLAKSQYLSKVVFLRELPILKKQPLLHSELGGLNGYFLSNTSAEKAGCYSVKEIVHIFINVFFFEDFLISMHNISNWSSQYHPLSIQQEDMDPYPHHEESFISHCKTVCTLKGWFYLAQTYINYINWRHTVRGNVNHNFFT